MFLSVNPQGGRGTYVNNSGHLIFSENISILIDSRCSGIALLDTLHLETFFAFTLLQINPKKDVIFSRSKHHRQFNSSCCMDDLKHVGAFISCSGCKCQRSRAAALILFVRRRVLGGAGVQLVAGYDPSAPPPPGARESALTVAFVQDELPDVGGRKAGGWFYR